MNKCELTADLARRLFNYDPISGAMFWRESPRRNVPAGALAGALHPSGYLIVKVRGVSCQVHRLAWLMIHGHWPAQQLDHINGVRNDNRIGNLRECTPGENCQNTALYGNNSSGYTGVSWHKASCKWRARIDQGGVQHVLGYFGNKELAREAYLQAKAAFHSFQPVPRYA